MNFFKSDIQKNFPVEQSGRYIRTVSLLLFIFFQTVISQDYYQAVHPITETEVMCCDGKKYRGKIIYAAESMLALWQKDSSFHADHYKDCLQVFDSYNIERISFIKKSKFWGGAGTGALIGAGTGIILGLASGDDPPNQWFSMTAGEKALFAGLFLGATGAVTGGFFGAAQGVDDIFWIGGKDTLYEMHLMKLRLNSICLSDPPVALVNYLQQRLPDPPILAKRKIPYERFHITLALIRTGTKAEEDIYNSLISSGLEANREENYSSYTFHLEAAYAVADKWRIGFMYLNMPKTGSYAEGISETADGRSYIVYGEYIPSPLTPLYRKNYELAFGAGILYHVAHIEGDYPGYTCNKETLGLNLHAAIRYYLFRNFSIQLKLNGRLIPNIELPDRMYYFDWNSYEPKIHKAHNINFSAIDLSFGLQFHL
jgi:hypothetical protein